IYGVTAESGTPIPISGIHMLHAAFERGATVLRTRKGVEYRQLSMRRGDMRSAIAILTRAHARFGQGG
ncbi:MAG TPA: hypothetical protein VNC62_00205, partial [Burkholderiales bacterium]|nr:hypothetical protein [Burkholderiales bacterium]